MTTKIEWVQGADGERGMTWNPIRGCSRISPGCGGGGSYSGTAGQRGGCYAEGIAARFSGPGQPFHGFAEMTAHGPRWTGKVALVPEKLAEPLRRKKPTTWFLSMFDPFHERLTNEEIAALFGVMAACPQHTFQVLTKRAERLPEWFAWLDREASPTPHGVLHVAVAPLIEPFGREDASGMDESDRAMERLLDAEWPLPNVWLGCSVESRKFKGRIDHLRRAPAAVRFLSLEPLLEDLGELDLTGIHQVIAGAESGPGARPMQDDWVRSIRDQAKAQCVQFFFKQKLDARGHKVSLPMLDGRQWAEMPARAVTA
ncbi:DUF5131 family protein [Sorangium sp. So ce388]|uniref:DUF5131 family protein n=1 Tax=Sorangium sp. So ce388 TaxID=3133309 RepID=UPI003F5B3E2C